MLVGRRKEGALEKRPGRKGQRWEEKREKISMQKPKEKGISKERWIVTDAKC